MQNDFTTRERWDDAMWNVLRRDLRNRIGATVPAA